MGSEMCIRDRSFDIAKEAGDQAGVTRVNAFLLDSTLAHRNSLKGTEYREKYLNYSG